FTLLLVVMSFTVSKAQLANGSVAPNWTMSDINGQSHTLYNYLDSGYVVFLDFTATWCPPCWSYHNTHAFADLYTQYGPGTADNKVRVFAIEGDASTTSADLHGTGSNTQGDWVTGVPYPIIDDASQTTPYNIGFWPTIYKVCPNRIITVVGQLDKAGLWAEAQKAECAAAVSATDAMILSYDGTSEVCGGAAATPSVTIQNFGTSALTSATIDVKDGNTVVASQSWTGSLATYDTETITLANLTPNKTTTYTFEVTTSGDANAANNTFDQEILVAALTGSDNFVLEINTDQYGGETYWAITDANNIIWKSGGNQAVGINGGGQGQPQGSSGYSGDATITENITLPSDGCYKFTMVDAYGDGMCCSFGNGSYKLTDEDNNVLATGSEFGATDVTPFEATTFSVGVDKVTGLNDLNIFPNPVTVNLNVQFNLAERAELTINVTNTLGQTVKVVNTSSLDAGQQNLNVNTSDLSAGIYFLNFSNGTQSTTKRFVVAK
ncbi:MAG: T9SS type A sorting domain-containing protein, partial [Saprospiraceae bacterium]